MPASFPPLQPVRVRSAGASGEGPRRQPNEDAFGIFEDESAALAIVADGMGGMRGAARRAADTTVETAAQMFRGRHAAVALDLAETWWRGEHGTGAAGTRVRPFSALPVRERVELREHVERLLGRRVPESLGDLAVLEAELESLLAIPVRALTRAHGELSRYVEKNPSAQGSSALSAAVFFAAGRASIAHVGDSRVHRVRGRSIEALTRDHTIHNDYTSLPPAQRTLSEAQLAQLPANLLTRTLGLGASVMVESRHVTLEPGDIFLLSTSGLWRSFSEDDLRAAIAAHGIGAATQLVSAGVRGRPDQPGDDLTAVVVEVR